MLGFCVGPLPGPLIRFWIRRLAMMKTAIFVALFGLIEAADEGDIVGSVFGGIAILALVVGVC